MKEQFIITIGREFGSGGRQIGMMLAEKLGIKCYDKELLAIAAKNSGLSEELLKNHDERPTNSFYSNNSKPNLWFFNSTSQRRCKKTRYECRRRIKIYCFLWNSCTI